MPSLASQARITISCSQGKKTLKRCKGSKVSSGGSTKVETAMGEDEGAGHTRAPGGYTISLQILQEQGLPEIDYELLESTQEPFTVEREIVGGRRWQYLESKVSKVDPDDDDQGKHMLDVEIVALRRKKL
jgi:hypothetical protein